MTTKLNLEEVEESFHASVQVVEETIEAIEKNLSDTLNQFFQSKMTEELERKVVVKLFQRTTPAPGSSKSFLSKYEVYVGIEIPNSPRSVQPTYKLACVFDSDNFKSMIQYCAKTLMKSDEFLSQFCEFK